MPSYVKAIAHTVLTIVALVAPTYITQHPDIFNISLGTAIGIVLNFLLSHTVATTTGASAKQ